MMVWHSPTKNNRSLLRDNMLILLTENSVCGGAVRLA